MQIELLAPARDEAVARIALLCGADAVYIGAPSHGARAAAPNTIDAIARVADFAHGFGARVYVALNTIIYDHELAQVEKTIGDLYRVGADALIVQDMGILEMDIPPIDLHASTQCDIRTPEKAAALAACGFSQLVLPREMSLQQIAQVRQAVPQDVALEAFVHGALCVSYSGDCHASCAALGRSANRGECAQMCRMAYDLTDADGKVLIANRHFLSLRDLNRLERLPELLAAGVSSLKIEGRLKDADYVANVVSAYRQTLDSIISSSDGRYARSSFGVSTVPFTPDVNKAFNRGFTTYFLDGRPDNSAKMANHATPKWVGQPIGVVRKQQPDCIVADLRDELHNGDGLGYFTHEGSFNGFRLNRIDGNKLYPASKVRLTPGTKLYRNRDTAWDSLLANAQPQRKITVDIRLYAVGSDRIVLRMETECGAMVALAAYCTLSPAKTPQTETRRRALTKLGDSAYRLREYTDELSADLFVPASVLAELRRSCCQALDRAIRLNHHFKLRRPAKALPTADAVISYHANVANSLARKHYQKRGAKQIEDAMEISNNSSGKVVMTTRYCLRRELGACLRTPEGTRLPSDLRLHNDAASYRLCFDCKNCQMQLVNEHRSKRLDHEKP